MRGVCLGDGVWRVLLVLLGNQHHTHTQSNKQPKNKPRHGRAYDTRDGYETRQEAAHQDTPRNTNSKKKESNENIQTSRTKESPQSQLPLSTTLSSFKACSAPLYSPAADNSFPVKHCYICICDESPINPIVSYNPTPPYLTW